MRIAVCIKQVPDTEARLRLDAEGRWIDEQDLPFVINESDECALEEGANAAGTQYPNRRIAPLPWLAQTLETLVGGTVWAADGDSAGVCHRGVPLARIGRDSLPRTVSLGHFRHCGKFGTDRPLAGYANLGPG